MDYNTAIVKSEGDPGEIYGNPFTNRSSGVNKQLYSAI